MPTSSRPRHPRRRPPTGPATMPVHAHLLAADDHVVGGGALRGEEWVLVLRGSVAAVTDSPSMLIAMLRHTAAMLEVRLRVSPVLSERAAAEAAMHGLELEAYLAQLEAERLERLNPDAHTRQ